jgi:hypothetical protein
MSLPGLKADTAHGELVAGITRIFAQRLLEQLERRVKLLPDFRCPAHGEQLIPLLGRGL